MEKKSRRKKTKGYHADHRLSSLLLIIARSFLLKLRGRQSRDVRMEMTTFIFYSSTICAEHRRFDCAENFQLSTNGWNTFAHL